MALSNKDLQQITSIIQGELENLNCNLQGHIASSNDKLFNRLIHILREFPTQDDIKDLLKQPSN